MSTMPAVEKESIMKALDVKKYMTRANDEVVLASRKLQILLDNNTIDDGDIEEEIHAIKRSATDGLTKMAAKIATHYIHRFRSSSYQINSKGGEATLTIEALRPFFLTCIAEPIQGSKFEW